MKLGDLLALYCLKVLRTYTVFAWSNWILTWMAKKQIWNLFLFTLFLPTKHVKIALPVGPKPHRAGTMAGTWCYSGCYVKSGKCSWTHARNKQTKQRNLPQKFTVELLRNHGNAESCKGCYLSCLFLKQLLPEDWYYF